MKRALVCGAGGFIGGHLVNRLKAEGYWVRGVDLKYHEYGNNAADEFVQGDLRNPEVAAKVVTKDLDEVYQLAADMGGAGYIFTGENDANVMHNSSLCNLNVLDEVRKKEVGVIFYSSSACMYPEHNQEDPDNPLCSEDSAYPAAPDSEYGWEKLFSERLYLSYHRNYGTRVRIARFHNIYGPEGTWTGGREKAPAALCRKVAQAKEHIDIWGDGQQTRSFLYVDECVEGILRITRSDAVGPFNLGSTKMIKINDLARLIMRIAGKVLAIRNVEGPTGVRGRNSDNARILSSIGWAPKEDLEGGLRTTYAWIQAQVSQAQHAPAK